MFSTFQKYFQKARGLALAALLLGSLPFFFTSCSDFFEKEIAIDPPDYVDQLVIHSFFDPVNDSILNILVTRPQEIFGVRDLSGLVDDAVVSVIAGGNELEVNHRQLTNINHRPLANFYTGNISVDPGDEIFIRVSHEDRQESVVSQVVPQPVIPDSVIFIERAGIDVDGESRSGFDIYFSDPPGEENFYYISGIYRSQFLTFYFSLESLEPGSETYNRGVIIRDQTFDGEDVRLRLLIPNSFLNLEAQYFELTFRTVTRDFYRHVQSVERYENSIDNPFVAPAQLYTNVEGGLGIFGIKWPVLAPVR